MAVTSFAGSSSDSRSSVVLWTCGRTQEITAVGRSTGGGAVFSPDGRHLAWIESSGRAHRGGWIVVSDSNGTHPRRLTPKRVAWLSTLVWSPDSTSLAVEQAEVRRVYDAKTGTGQIVDRRNARGPAWRSDGALTWRDSELGIAILEPGTAEPRSLIPPHAGREPFGLDWSPDGQRLAYAELDRPMRTSRIVTVSRDGGDRKALKDPVAGGGDVIPRWSPDGSELAFLRIARMSGELPLLRLMTVPGGGGEPRAVKSAPLASVGFADDGGYDWRPEPGCSAG